MGHKPQPAGGCPSLGLFGTLAILRFRRFAARGPLDCIAPAVNTVAAITPEAPSDRRPPRRAGRLVVWVMKPAPPPGLQGAAVDRRLSAGRRFKGAGEGVPHQSYWPFVAQKFLSFFWYSILKKYRLEIANGAEYREFLVWSVFLSAAPVA